MAQPPAPIGRELHDILDQAERVARSRDERPTTAHALLVLLRTHGLSAQLMRDRRVTEEGLKKAMSLADPEPKDLLAEAGERARRVATDCGSASAGPLHFLIAAAQLPRSAAKKCLTLCCCDVPALRNKALAALRDSGRVPLRLGANAAARPSGAPRATGLGPDLGLGRPDRTARPLARPPGRAASSDPPRSLRPARPARPDRAPASRAEPKTDLRPESAAPARAAARPANHAANHARNTTAAGPAFPAELFELDRETFPWLTSLGRNLCVAAARGEIDPLVGRDAEVTRVIDILNKRRSNNPCLVGPPGVGKTAIVEGLALRIVRDKAAGLGQRIVVEVQMSEVIAGTSLRGTLSERLMGLREEVKKAERRVVVFFDELHTLLAAGGADGPMDAAQEMKGALARGEFPSIGATTPEEYRKFIEPDAALCRRFTRVEVDPPSLAEALQILRGVAPRYAAHHEVGYDDAALEAAVRLSARYVLERHLPDKAINVIDLAGARARREKRGHVGAPEIAEVVADVARVPRDRVCGSDEERLLRLEAHLGERIVGHAESLRRIAQALRRNAAGFRTGRPIGSFLLLGPTGCGKTETARALAEFLFAAPGSFTRIDLSEYAEPHAVARLVGAPPGYIGHDEGGQLTEAVRARPYQLVLFDEADKAHREVLQLLLQLLDDGRLTDSRGRVVSFEQTVVILTSNHGAEAATPRIGFASGSDRNSSDAHALAAVRAALPPELFGRLDEVLYFGPLDREAVREVARRLLRASASALRAARAIDFEFDDSLVEALLDHGGYDPKLGARPMRRTIQQLVEGPLSERILRGEIHRGDRVRIRAADGDVIRFERQPSLTGIVPARAPLG